MHFNCKSLFVLFALFLATCLNAFCNSTDSLKSLISTSRDTSKINLINELSREYYLSSAYDSAIKYANQALKLSEQESYVKGQSNAYENLAEVYYNLESFQKSVDYYSRSIEGKQILGDKKGIAYCLHVVAMLYRKMNSFEKAIDYEFKSLKIAEEIHDRRRIAYVSNGIGIIYHTLNQYDKALQYYDAFLKISIELNDQADIADAYNNLGTIYLKIANDINDNNDVVISTSNKGVVKSEKEALDKALHYFRKALQIYTSNNEKRGLALVYSNIGDSYRLINKLDSAKIYQEKSLQIEIERNNREGIAYSYSTIADLYKSNGDINNAIALKKKALSYTLENDLSQRIYDELTKLYIIKGNTDDALKYHRLSLSLKDTIYNRETKNVIAEIQTKYETEKKEKEIQILTKEKEVQALKLKKKTFVIYAISGTLFFIILLVLVILRAYKLKNRSNQLLIQKNSEILSQKEEIESQRDEIEAQRDLLVSQKKNITDSILYAQKIQQAVLPAPEIIESNLLEHFVLFRPRDIVSGDFYWLKRVENLVYIAVVDCTGHGVPGAFMSMLGVSFLNEILNDKEIRLAGDILSKMRDKVKSSLHQRGLSGEQKDGMDMALCILDCNTLQLQYAGAHIPLYLIRKGISLKGFEVEMKLEESDTHSLYELKANRQSVAISQKEVEFSTYSITLEKGDTFYLFTDGFQDQLGGGVNEKYKPQRLKKLLLNSASKTMDEQRQILERSNDEWRMSTDQTDDILAFGVKV